MPFVDVKQKTGPRELYAKAEVKLTGDVTKETGAKFVNTPAGDICQRLAGYTPDLCHEMLQPTGSMYAGTCIVCIMP